MAVGALMLSPSDRVLQLDRDVTFTCALFSDPAYNYDEDAKHVLMKCYR